jgi:hypothetical protein
MYAKYSGVIDHVGVILNETGPILGHILAFWRNEGSKEPGLRKLRIAGKAVFWDESGVSF